jgi:spermidine/putrescine-binding protein
VSDEGVSGTKVGGGRRAPLRMLVWPGMPADEALDLVARRIGVEVEAVAISTNEQLEERLAAGERYDVITPSDYMVERLASAGALRALDPALLPGRAGLAGWARSPVWDPDERWSVPLACGTTGVLYDRSAIPDAAERGWGALFDPPPGARVGLLGELREVIGAALLACGRDVNATDDVSLAEAEALLTRRAEAVVRFDSDDFTGPVVDGAVVAHHAWSGPAAAAIRAEAARASAAPTAGATPTAGAARGGASRLAYAVPREGAILWVTTAAISAQTERPELAHAAIETLLDPQIARITVERNGYATPNAAARAVLAPELRDDPVLFPPDDVLAGCATVRDVGADGEERLARLWARVSRGGRATPA